MKADVLKTGKKMGKNRPKSSTDNAASTKSKSDFKGKKIHYKKKSELGKSAKKNVKKEPQEKQEKILSTNWKSFLKEAKEAPKAENKSQHPNDGKKTRTAKTWTKGKRKRKPLENNKANDLKNADMVDEKEIWFDDVDIEDIEHAIGKKIRMSGSIDKVDLDKEEAATPTDADEKPPPRQTKQVAVDCEMVGAGVGGRENQLARVSLVNSFGETIYDTFVAPMQKVFDYRTEFSGVRPEDLQGAPEFKTVQIDVAALTKGRILVGHSINNDLKVLLLSHPRKDIRDTANYKPFKKLLKTQYPSLKKLAKEILQVDIQSGEHSSVEDARCTMKIFQLHRKQWEKSLKEKGYKQTVDSTPKIFMGKKEAENAKKFKKRKQMERWKKRNESK